jgi:peroxiredoxin
MKRNILAFAAVGLLFASIGAYFGLKRLETEAPQNTAVPRFFALSLPDSNSQMQNMAQWKGKHLVVNFWATWCGPCVEEMPELSSLQTEIAQKNAQILGIGIDSPAAIREFSSKYKISYPLYVAGMGGSELSRQFGNQAGGLPFTVLIAPDGQVKKTYLGRLNLQELRRDLAIP